MYRGEPVRGIQGGYFIQDIDSAEGCQEECVNDPDCNYFTWNSPAFRVQRQRQKCWLKAGKGTIMTDCGRRCTGKISGPKTCKYSLFQFTTKTIKLKIKYLYIRANYIFICSSVLLPTR